MIAASYEQQLAGAIDAVRFRSEREIAWFGSRIDIGHGRGSETPQQRSETLAALERLLYAEFYCRGHAGPVRSRPRPVRPAGGGSSPFVNALSAANSGVGYWQPGWRCTGHEEGSVVVERRIRVWVRPDQCRAVGDLVVDIGCLVEVRQPKESRTLSPGFYMCFGDETLDDAAAGSVMRLYWNTNADSATELVRLLSGKLNAAAVPFVLKTADEPSGYDRCDAAVLYLRARHLAASASLVIDAFEELRDGLGEAVPALTYAIAPGLGLAEDPGGGRSFGQHRCRLIAEALIDADEAKARPGGDRLAFVRDALTARGVDWTRPFATSSQIDDVLRSTGW